MGISKFCNIQKLELGKIRSWEKLEVGNFKIFESKLGWVRPNILLSDLPALLQSSKVISSKSSKSSKIRSWEKLEVGNFEIFKYSKN